MSRILEEAINNVTTYVYNPSVTIFDSCIFIQYKKVGTRYISGIASYPFSEMEDCYQIDLFFQTTSDSVEIVHEYNHLHTQFYDSYVQTKFDVDLENQSPAYFNEMGKFKKFTNTKEFLEYGGVKNFTEFCFDNPKDLYFVIRNPIDRFLSGVVQTLLTSTNAFIFDQKHRDEIKFHTKLSDADLKIVSKTFSNANSDVAILNEIPNNILFPIIEYTLEKKWDILFDDVHTENYLHNINEWMYNIKDKSKIKIVDVSQFSSDKAKKLFSSIRPDIDLTPGFKSINHYKSSNKEVYSNFLVNNSMKNLSFYSYLKTEMQIYLNLKNSPYFVDLSDE